MPLNAGATQIHSPVSHCPLLGCCVTVCMCVDTGADVARKVVILARECGLQVGLDDLQVSSLVPQPLQGLASADEFMQQLPQVRLRGVSTEQSGADVACGGGGRLLPTWGTRARH